MEGIPALCYEGDEPLRASPTPPEAHLWPSAVVTWGRWPALTGVGQRACSRWRPRASRPWFPRWPARPRLLRLFTPPHDWPPAFLAAPPVLGGLDP